MATTKDYRLGEFTFPRGWFMIAEAANSTPTAPGGALLRQGLRALPRPGHRQGGAARRLLPAHEDAPGGAQQDQLRHPGRHGHQRRGRRHPLPLPRLALRPRRQVRRHPLPQGRDPGRGLRQELDRGREPGSGLRLARPRGRRARVGTPQPAAMGRPRPGCARNGTTLACSTSTRRRWWTTSATTAT
jgi:hypothetical protein